MREINCLKRKYRLAAHCFYDKETDAEGPSDAEELLVYLGAHNLIITEMKLERGSVSRKVNNVLIHDGWNPEKITYNHDIALLYLESKVDFSTYIQPICLLTTN